MAEVFGGMRINQTDVSNKIESYKLKKKKIVQLLD